MSHSDLKPKNYTGIISQDAKSGVSKAGKAYATAIMQDSNGKLWTLLFFSDVDIASKLIKGQKISVLAKPDGEEPKLFVQGFSLPTEGVQRTHRQSAEKQTAMLESLEAQGIVLAKDRTFRRRVDCVKTDEGWVPEIDYLMDQLGAEYVTKRVRERFSYDLLGKKFDVEGWKKFKRELHAEILL